MKIRPFELSRLLSLFVICSPSLASAADLTKDYQWNPMKIGGGGYVVGLSVNPAEKGLVYARTDVSGAYRWNPNTRSWKQVVTSASLPPEYVAYGRYCGVDSIVGAPSEPNVVYMMMANQAYAQAVGQVFKSQNRGETWTATNFRNSGVMVEANGEGRQEGERLAVDPLNSNVVYYGSIKDGFWVTQNGGTTWAKIDAIPAGKAPHGVNTIVFDRTGGNSKSADGAQKSNVIYVTIEEGGVYQTSDAGASWKKISDAGAGDSGKPRDATVGKDGTYYVTYDNEKGATGAIWKYRPASGWTNITPQHAQGGKDKPYWAITVDPFDSKHIVAMIHGGRTFVSKDQGQNWTFHDFALKSPNITWLGTQTNYFLSTGELEFDAHEKGKLWYAEGFGVWNAYDLTTPRISWKAVSEGIEEVCGNDVIAPPKGKPVGAMWDAGAMYFEDVDTYTAKRTPSTFMSAWALDWCATDPKFLVGVFRSHLDFVANYQSSGFSTDGGKTWTRFAALEKGTLPKDLDYGTIAVSANNPDHIVWSPAANKMPYYTTNRGESWTKSNFGGEKQTGHHGFPSPIKPLCADRVAADTFYFYTPQEGVFRSTDGGATFTEVGNPLSNRWNVTLKATPGIEGDLWFSSGDGSGLYHSTDGGVSWKKKGNFHSAFNVGIGKSQSGDYPTIFVAGNVLGETGIFRSTDRGQTWDKIVDYPLGIFDSIDALDGDKEIFGQVYVSFAGAGFAYGKPKPLTR